ncbi:GPI inositol-deacylase [Lucilia sericata]|uniref:GPI inositol-deacylase n=1 Tax=Lucilia sericata TaxID=13632 RepID=UPI0018A8223F|nr:GPI inositol-deacylase [Lucilia sericata]
MFKNFFIFAIIISFGAFLYGIRHIFLEVEENACRMTYMFGVPQFSKVTFDENKQYNHYGLYYYYEGRLQKDVNNLVLNGAPVIFVPGNAGSYKQVRSLASVALRKGMDNERGIHLDYFTINYEEQLSGLYGGYLENQKQFLRLSILAVQNLYKKSSNIKKQVIIIGHSMGGKVAQAVLEETDIAPYINTIIFISTPLDKPVVDFDSKLNEFYAYSDRYLSDKRVSYVPNIDTNVCTNYNHRIPLNKNESQRLDNVLMISIGGGNRDLLVRDALTTSKYSDIHAMTPSIPKVWLSCDHLSAVWCLQLVMVVNRFIFGISNIDKNKNVFFVDDKSLRMQNAINYFVKPLNKYKSNEIYFPKSTIDATWHEDSKIVYRKLFKNGLRAGYNHMLPISKYKQYKKIFIEINSYDELTDWIYGCTATNVTNSNIIKCDKGSSLSHNIQNVASHDNIRSMVLIDLQHLNKYNPQWTHIMIRFLPTNKPITFKLDVYNKKERTFIIKAPRWFSFDRKTIINETVYGNIHYEISIEGLDEPFPTLQFDIEPIGCGDKDFNVATKLCIPWARGYERYSHITQLSREKSIYVNVPMSAPIHYNTSENPVSLELFLDPVCRYQISYKFSIAGTMSKIVQEFYHWIPAHLTAVLFVVLRNQIVKFQSAENTLFVKPYAGFFQCKSLYIITGCRLLKKLLLPVKFLPTFDKTEYSFYVSIIIHSTAIVASIILVFTIWTILTFNGNILMKIALRITRISVTSSDVLVQIISTLPLTFGVLFISIAFATCSGIALILASVFYFILLSNAYKDYLENWAWEKATGLFRKLRTSRNDPKQINSDQTIVPAAEAQHEHENQESNDYFQGLENFPFHITMLLLLVITSALNFGLSIAWIKSHYLGHVGENLPDPFLISTIVVLSCLSILLQLNAPHKSSGYRVVAVVLYFCACLCIIYCQENLYRLNYIIAFIYVIVALQEITRRLMLWFGIQF